MSEARVRFERVARRAASALALALVFVLASAAGLVIHLDTPPGRRIVASSTNELVSKLLVSDLEIERIDTLSPTRLFVSRASLRDRLGKPVLVAEGLDVRFGLVDLLRGILGDRDVRVVVPDVRAERVSVWLRRDPERGVFTIETAFDPTPSGPPNPNAPRVFVALPRIAVKEAIVTTNQPGIERATARVGELAAGLDVSPAGLVLTLNSDRTNIQKLLPRDVTGRLRSALRLPGTTRAELDVRAGQVPLKAELGWRGAELDLRMSSNELGPASMRDLFGAWPLVVPLSASARAVGAPEAMKAETQGRLGDCHISGEGSLVLASEVRSDLTLHAKGLDLRAFDAAAPETALDVDATVTLRYAGELEVQATATLPESTISGYPIPPLAVRGRYTRGTFAGSATVLDPKLATEADFEISPDGKIAFRTKSPNVELEALARYGVNAKGRATVRSSGVLDDGRLVATFDASSSAPSVEDVRAEKAVVEGRIEGPLARPDELSVDVVVQGEKLAAAGVTLERFRATSKGSGAKQAVTLEGSSGDGGALDASAELALSDRPALSEVRLRSARGGDSVEVTAEHLAFEPGGFSVRELSFRSGEGTMSGSIVARGERRLVDVVLRDVDLGRALSALGVRAPGIAGRIDGHVRFEEVGSERNGDATLRLSDGAIPPLDGVTAELGAEFRGTEIEADAALAVRDAFDGKLAARGSLRRSVFAPGAARELTGKATLAFSDVDVERASQLWLDATGVSLRGRASGSMTAIRNEPAGAPAVSYRLSTKDLVISRAGDEGEPPSELPMNIDSAGDLLGPEGSRMAVELVDAEGAWITAAIEHSLGAVELAGAGAGWKRALLDAPLRATIKVHRRPLRMLGDAGATALSGSVAGVVGVSGNAREPEIDVSASLSSRSDEASDEQELEVALQYSAKQERYALEARTVGKRDQLEITSSGRFGWIERGFGRDWSAIGEVSLKRYGLARLGRFLAVPLEGEASGRCSFDLAAGRLEAKGDVKVDRVSIERHSIGSGTGRLTVENGRAQASLDLEAGRSKLEVLGGAGVVWGDEGPMLDASRDGSIRATAREFELASLRPFVRDVATRLGGRLNGHVELVWMPKGSSGRQSTTLRANATVSEGTASLSAGGGVIQKIHVQALADGDGPLRLTFSGAARSREPNVDGKADVFLDGPRLKRLDAKFDVKAFPLLYDGVLLGRATSGARAPLEFSIVAKETGQTIDVHIPAVEVTLPKASDKSLIALDDDHSIEVSDAPLDPEEQSRATKAPSKTTLKVRLGKQVRVKRGNLDVPVTGAITVAPDGRLSGAITFPPGGVVPALGQLFRIRRGSVSFKNQDVAEGTIAIQAWTRASEGTLIDLDVSGTVKNPVVAFHSDPPRSEDEIVALLLGIQTDTSANAESDESEQFKNTAIALAMNRLVEDSMLSGLQFGAGETGSGDSVSTVTMRVGSKVWFEGRQVRGNQHSVNPDERVSGVVDWRFAPSWSLRTQLGEVSGVEIRWSLRY